MELLNDLSVMEYGKFKGKPLKAIPAYYLLWLRSEFLTKGFSGRHAIFNKALHQYIEDNLDGLNGEAGFKKR